MLIIKNNLSSFKKKIHLYFAIKIMKEKENLNFIQVLSILAF